MFSGACRSMHLACSLLILYRLMFRSLVTCSLFFAFGCAIQVEAVDEDTANTDAAILAEWLWPQANFNAVLAE